ncbi:MAG: phosphoribosylformylglycinamidine synthase, partial [Planctomycetia bacterium]|nr:phosphoribosylformylglycinamidine synthase [Planctomycetia bacterium]
TVIRGVLGRDRGIALGVGLRHRLGSRDPYQMAAGGIVEAIANVVATGADPDRIALLDNFCWGDTRRPESLATLVEACRACHDMALEFMAPFVSGKDSLNNVFAWTDSAGTHHERSIPPTLLATAVGQIDDVRRTVTTDLKRPGDRLAIVGLSRGETAGSQLELAGLVRGGRVPAVDPHACRAAFHAVAEAARAGVLSSCHDCSDGGLLTAVAEMAIAGGLGATIDLDAAPRDIAVPTAALPLATAFTETPGRFICAVPAAVAERFAESMGNVPWAWLGGVTAAPTLDITAAGATIQVPVEVLARAWRGEARADGTADRSTG